MNNLKFKYLRAKNVVCFGEDGIEITFSEFGNIVCVKGINKDLPASEGVPANNAAGKSSLQELLSIGLYNKTVKYPKKNGIYEILNTVVDGDGEIEICLDDIRILRKYNRTSKTQKLRIWQSKTHIWDDESEITKGKSTTETQKWIEGYIGLDHHAFCTVCIFDDRSTYSFLEAETKDMKRKIVQSLLGLDQYQEYAKSAKEILKNKKKIVTDLSKEYESLKINDDACDGRILKLKEQEEQWLVSKKIELKKLMERLSTKQVALTSTDVGEEVAAYQRAQDRTEELALEIADLNEKREKIVPVLKEAKERIESAEDSKVSLRGTVQEHLSSNNRL
jgi:DNA repair exonuclease SbcCD ATPase subunit